MTPHARHQAQVLGGLQVHLGLEAVLLRVAQVDDALDHLSAHLRLELDLPVRVVDEERGGAESQPLVQELRLPTQLETRGFLDIEAEQVVLALEVRQVVAAPVHTPLRR